MMNATSRTITFLRTRPAEAATAAVAEARLREGTTTLEMDSPGATDFRAAHQAGLFISALQADPSEAALIVDPDQALKLAKANTPGWLITVRNAGPSEAVLDALARSEATYLRATRSTVEAAAALCSLPAIEAVVSVFADDVDQAETAVLDGAGDLLFRDWDADRIGDLRQRLAPHRLVERTALPPGLEIDEVRQVLSRSAFRSWLQQVDASGAARPRYTWAPGRAEAAPVPPRRFSAAWPDSMWVGEAGPEELEGAGSLRPILERSLSGSPPEVAETEALFGARGDQVEAVAWTADQLRRRTVGDLVTYVVNRNINYTNLCYFRCGFCAFSKGPRSLNLRGDPYLMSIADIVRRAREAWEKGATEVTLQGGIHPEFTGDFYVRVTEAIKAELPEMHIHGFTPLEVWQGAETLGVPVRDFLVRLKEAGLGTLPGTAAEILDDDVRRYLCPDKIRTSQWAQVMLTAHELGLKATATIMFGHIDHHRSWARHLDVIRQIQARTGGFTELVPLPFVHMGAPIWLNGKARPGPTWDEVVLIHAIGRIALDGMVPNIQASWVKLGLDGAARLLDAGCNDLGGTLMGEIITRSAGAAHGQELTPEDFRRAIIAMNRQVGLRDTEYGLLLTA
ncbi:MAG: 5-amino-6-(D-ribitylamino)uracil--L-tyrosine 4-hydroxyphenyl transferase CofH [bacterium]|nr:5-amino-6-(D-ribitylamino)uracil--L-tyrosine 4-hydroxyphenyl transferase CofH [bacterium]